MLTIEPEQTMLPELPDTPRQAEPAPSPGAASGHEDNDYEATSIFITLDITPLDTETPGIAMPDTPTPGATTPDTLSSGTATPGTTIPATSTPGSGTATPDTAALGTSTPGIATPASETAPSGTAAPATAPVPTYTEERDPSIRLTLFQIAVEEARKGLFASAREVTPISKTGPGAEQGRRRSPTADELEYVMRKLNEWAQLTNPDDMHAQVEDDDDDDDDNAYLVRRPGGAAYIQVAGCRVDELPVTTSTNGQGQDDDDDNDTEDSDADRERGGGAYLTSRRRARGEV
ncbi:hypothetical protein N656DRAFT_831933 [Canariomyces notabilis]|uniref:Uncharacterized protein n=1 Tax=Canariomyces notabilis TaxID=2074819 RepID=A0AAN6T9M3_9PEZI|nr:hypothetical protein N656DRAFT_831933 [Canariomyces arenarius]